MIARLLIASLLTADPTPDAGVAQLTVESLYVACPDAPLAEVVDGGYFVPEQRARRQTCQLSACEAFATPRLEQPAGDTSPGLVIALVAAGLVAAGLAAAGGYVAGRAAK